MIRLRALTGGERRSKTLKFSIMATTIFMDRCYEQAITIMQLNGSTAIEQDISISSTQHHGFVVNTRRLLFSTTDVVTDFIGLNISSKTEIFNSTQKFESEIENPVNTIKKITCILNSYSRGIYVLTFKVFIRGPPMGTQMERLSSSEHKPPSPPRGPSASTRRATPIPFAFPQMGITDMLGFGDFKDASSSVKELVDRVQSGIIPDMEMNAESLRTLFSNITELVDKNKGVDMANGAREVLRDIGNLDQKISNQLYKATSMIFFVSALTFYLTSEDKKKEIILGIAIACLIIFWFDRIHEIGSRVCDLVGMGGPKAQSGLGHESLLTGMVTMMMGLSLKSGNAGKISDKVMKHLSGFERIKSSLGGILKFFTELVVVTFEKMNMESMLPDGFRYLCITEDNIMETVKKVDDIKAQLKSGEYMVTRENLFELHEIKKHLLTIQSKTPNLPATRGSLTIVHDVLREVGKIIDTFNSQFMCSIRQEPVSVMIKGAPGTLKSQVLKRLGIALTALTLPEHKMSQDPDKHMYVRAVETEYWDGYANQLITIVDDFGQFVEVAGNLDGEAPGIIRMYNELAAPLHMAKVEDKGTTWFTSAYILLTTNLELFQFDSVRDSNAIRRRFDICVVPAPKEEFIDDTTRLNAPHHQKVDIAKLPLGVDGVSSVDPQVALNFHGYDIKTSRYTGEVFDFDELVTRTYDLQCLKNKWFKQQEYELKGVHERFLNKRVERPKAFIDQLKESANEITTEMNELFFEAEVPNPEQEILMNQIDDWMGGPRAQGNFGDLNLEAKKKLKEKARNLIGVHSNLFVEDISIMKSEIQEIVDGMLADEEQDSPVRAYYDTLVKIMRSNTKFNVCTANFCLWLLCNHDPFDFINGVSSLSEDYLDHVFETCNEISICGPMLKVDFKSGTFYERMIILFAKMKANIFTPLYDGFMSAVKWLQKPEVYIGLSMCLVAIGGYTAAGMFIHKTFKDVKKGLDIGEVDKDGNPVKSAWHEAYKAKLNGDVSAPVVIPESKFAMSIEEIKARGGDVEIEILDELPKIIPEGAYSMKEHKVVARIVRPKPQMGYAADSSGCQQTEKFLRTNMYEIMFNDTHVGFATFIEGHVAMCNYHFLSHFMLLVKQDSSKKNQVITFRRLTKGDPKISKFCMTIDEFIKSCKPIDDMVVKDLVLFEAKDHHPHKNLVSLFPTYTQMKDIKGSGARLIHKGNDGITSHVTKAIPLDHFDVQFDGVNFSPVRDGFTYVALTEEGDCGAWLQVLDPKSSYKVIGIHVAGDQHVFQGKSGFATGIFKELIEKGLSQFPERVRQEFPNVGLPQLHGVVAGRFDEAYTASIPNRSAYKSQIMESPLYDVITEHKEKPCHLRTFTNAEGVKIDPFKVAIDKYCKEPIMLHQETRSAIVGSMVDYLKKVSEVKLRKGLLTFEEAILGLSDEVYFKAIPRSTSAGYPLNTEQKAGFSGKQRFFGKDQDYDLTRKECVDLKIECERVIKELENGNRVEFIFADNLKDETKAIEKVEQGKTRLFNSCPLVYLIVWRMYFGRFSVWYTNNMIFNGSAIGMCPYGEHWNVLAREFNKFRGGDTNVFVGAGDYSAFDASERIAILNDIRDVILKIIDDSSTSKVCRMLWLEVINSYHIKGASVYEWIGSLPSGHPFTTVINCLYNHYAFRYCWFRANDNDLGCLWLFDHYIYLIVMGDDNAFSVHPLFRKAFNEVTIEPFMREIGLTYTNDLKVVSEIPLRTLEEITFMKRSFRYEPILGRYVAPLSMDSIYETLNWVKKSADFVDLSASKVDLAVDELSLHGVEVFEEKIDELVNASEEYLDHHPNSTYFLEILPRVSKRTSFFG